MTRRRKPPLWKDGWTPVQREAAAAVGSQNAAAMLEVIWQLAGDDGWATATDDTLAAEIPCDPSTVTRIRHKLVERGLVEVGEPDVHRRTRYRLIDAGLDALVLGSERNSGANAVQNAATPTLQNAATDPLSGWDSGSENGRSRARAQDGDRDGDGERDLDPDLEEERPPAWSRDQRGARANGRAGLEEGNELGEEVGQEAARDLVAAVADATRTPERQRYRPFRAQFESTCADCGGTITKGTLQTRAPGPDKKYVHHVCPSV